jgi:Leucine rich repeat
MLFLSSNKFSGYIPSFLAGQSQSRLRGLYLSDNQLQGQIPESVCDLKYLEALFLDENQLSGFLPRCLGRLTKLTQLYAFKNELYGNVPEEFSRLEELRKSSCATLVRYSPCFNDRVLTKIRLAPFDVAVELGLEVNNMTGVVPDAVCALSDKQNINFWADCNSPNNTSLECPCCTSCCPASEGCA